MRRTNFASISVAVESYQADPRSRVSGKDPLEVPAVVRPLNNGSEADVFCVRMRVDTS